MEGMQLSYVPAGAEFDAVLREQLLERREKLQEARPLAGQDPDLARLLNEVDAALERFQKGTYGLCEECHDPIETDRLVADPLVRFCLGDLTQKQLDAMQQDMQLAAEIQRALLPGGQLSCDLWEVDLSYHPAGIVSGDYVDVLRHNGELYFILGDVSGKGMAASILMSNLHAMFRALIPVEPELCDLMARANRMFCESTLANHYATLIVGRMNAAGEVEMCNAGHLPPMIAGGGRSVELDSTGLPLGMFCDSSFVSSGVKLQPGETLLLFTDGVTEALSTEGAEFGSDRLRSSIDGVSQGGPTQLLQACVNAVSAFRNGAERNDDMTMLAIKFVGRGR